MALTVGQQDQRFAPGLLHQHVVGGEINSIVESGSSTLTTPAAPASRTTTSASAPTAAAATVSRTAAGIGRTGLRVVSARRSTTGVASPLRALNQVKSLFEFHPGRGQILKQFHFAIEVNQEYLVFVGSKNLFKELPACIALGRQHAAFASASIYQEAEFQRQVTLPGKIANLLRTAILFKMESSLLKF